MGQLVLLVVAAAWAAVLIPPLLRSRIENRPNSSVTDFRNQLSSLQKAMPSRAVSMRSMGRPLAPSPLSRPAATGRPALRSGVRTHNGATVRSAGQPPARPEPSRPVDLSSRRRSHGEERPTRRQRPTTAATKSGVKRRRANVLFVLALTAGCTLFLAATTKTDALYFVFGGTFVALCAYIYVLGQLRRTRAGVRAGHRDAGGPAGPAPGSRSRPSASTSARPAAVRSARCARPVATSRRPPGPVARRCARCSTTATAGPTPSSCRIPRRHAMAHRYTRGPSGL